jgi:hypothetical protein
MTWYFHCGEQLATLVGQSNIQTVIRAIEIALLSDQKVIAKLETDSSAEYPVYIVKQQNIALLGHVANSRQCIFMSTNRSRRGMFSDFNDEAVHIDLYNAEQVIKRIHVPECLAAHIRDAQR